MCHGPIRHMAAISSMRMTCQDLTFPNYVFMHFQLFQTRIWWMVKLNHIWQSPLPEHFMQSLCSNTVHCFILFWFTQSICSGCLFLLAWLGSVSPSVHRRHSSAVCKQHIYTCGQFPDSSWPALHEFGGGRNLQEPQETCLQMSWTSTDRPSVRRFALCLQAAAVLERRHMPVLVPVHLKRPNWANDRATGWTSTGTNGSRILRTGKALHSSACKSWMPRNISTAPGWWRATDSFSKTMLMLCNRLLATTAGHGVFLESCRHGEVAR